MRKKKEINPKTRMQIAIGLGIIVIVSAVFINYYLDQTKITGQQFGDQLAQIQLDLKNETLVFDGHLTEFKTGQIPKDQMLSITDNHIATLQKILPRYEKLNAPELFVSSLQLFKLSTETQIESVKALRQWIITGDNATNQKSEQLYGQSFQYEMNALQSYENAKTKGSQ